MDNIYKFPMPDSIIADSVNLIEAGTGSIRSENFVTIPRKNNTLAFIGINNGSLLFSEGDSVIGASQGSALLLPTTLQYSLFAETDAEYTYFILSGAFAHALMEKTISNGGLFFPNGATVLSGELSKLTHSQNLGIVIGGNTASLSAYAVLMKLYCKSSYQNNREYPELISDAIFIMRENFAFLYGIEDLAEQLFVSKNHLIRQFTKFVGVSPGKFLTAIRIEHAKLVLQSGETGLEAVAIASGFSDANYFCKVFKRETGMRPGEFLKSATQVEHAPIRNTVYL